jgi:predicted transport protein
VYSKTFGAPGRVTFIALTVHVASWLSLRKSPVVVTGVLIEAILDNSIPQLGLQRGKLIAEDITSRFPNVVSLFNGTIPLIAIQMQALKIGDSVTLVFTTVMDELSRGYIDEDEDAEAAPTDRGAIGRSGGSKATLGVADELLAVLKELDPSLEFKYNKFYIGLSKDGQPYNFVTFRPKKNQLNFELKLPQSDELDAKIEQAGIETLEYNKRWGLYRLRLTKDDMKSKGAVVKELARTAYERRSC